MREDRLLSAFDLLPAGELVAFVGGGGKTSLMFALARALAATQGSRVVTTTTTRIFTAQMKLATAVCTTADLHPLEIHLVQAGTCLVVGEVRGEKAVGVPPELPGRLLARPDVDFVLVEADGSRMRPVKAPAAHEPVVPPSTTLLVPVVGIDALDEPIATVAHRPELVSRLTGLAPDQHLTAAAVATLLVHAQGGLKDLPDGARAIPFINKVETAAQVQAAQRIAGLVLQNSRVAQVVIGAVKRQPPVREVHRRVTAVVLAAGEAKRMGQTKQLLPWGETTVLGQTLHHLQQSAVSGIIVVTGHQGPEVAAVAAAAGIPTLHNPHYASGEMLSSLQTAVRQLPPHCAAVLVVLADQPMVEPQTIDQLLQAYWQGHGEIVAPVFEGQRGNPVLIGRSCFDALLALPPGSAPRDLLKAHAGEVHLVNVASDAVLRDIDRPQEYERWRPK